MLEMSNLGLTINQESEGSAMKGILEEFACGNLNPSIGTFKRGILKTPRPVGTNCYWHSSTITAIPDSQDYLGHMKMQEEVDGLMA